MEQKIVYILTQRKERISGDSSFRYAPFGMTGVFSARGSGKVAASPPLSYSSISSQVMLSFRTQRSGVRNLPQIAPSLEIIQTNF